MTKQIPLTRGQVALVDDEDYERVMQYKWRVLRSRYTSYAGRVSSSPQKRKIYLHRFIMDAPDDVPVDHKNRDGLDCRRENLRLSTYSQNLFNRGKTIRNTSGYKGISWSERDKKWEAKIKANGVLHHLGRYTDILDAAHAYDEAAIKFHGEYAYLNFPQEHQQ